MGAWEDCPNLVSLPLIGWDSIFIMIMWYLRMLNALHCQFVDFKRYREDEFQDDHAAPYQVLLDTGGFIYSPSKSCIISIYLKVLW